MGELPLHDAQIPVGQLAIVEFTVIDALLEEAIDEGPNPLGTRVREDAGRRFHRVPQHRDAGLSRLWLRSGVGEIVRVDVGRALLGARLGARFLQEIADRLRAVVFADEVLDDLGQPGLVRHSEPGAHMVAQDLGALPRAEPVVRVESPRLVLDEVLRPFQLPDVVVVDPDPAQERVRADRLARRLDEVREVDRMGVGARSLAREPPEERPVHVGQLEQRLLRRASGEDLEQGQAHADAEPGAQGRVERPERRRRPEVVERIVAGEVEEDPRSEVRRRDEDDQHPALRAGADAGHREGRRDPAGHRHHGRGESREMRLAHEDPGDRGDDDQPQQTVEQRRGEESGQRHRDERRRTVRGGDDAGRRHHDDDESEQHGEAAQVLVDVAAEAICGEDEDPEHAHDEEDHAERMEEPRPRPGLAALDEFPLVGEQAAVLLLGDPRVLGDDAFPLEHEALELGDKGPGQFARLARRVLIDPQRRLRLEDQLLEEQRTLGRQPVADPFPGLPREVAQSQDLVHGPHPVLAPRFFVHDDVDGDDVGEIALPDHAGPQSLEGGLEFAAQPRSGLLIEEVVDDEGVDGLLGRDVDAHLPHRRLDAGPDERRRARGPQILLGGLRFGRGDDRVEPREEPPHAFDAAVGARRFEAEGGRDDGFGLVLLLAEPVRILRDVEVERRVDRLPGDAPGDDAVEFGERCAREEPGDGERDDEDDARPESVVDPRVLRPACRGPVHRTQVVADAAVQTQRSDSRYARMISFTRRCRTTSASSK